MKAISLFAGIGGFDLALKRNGVNVVYANEWDSYASKIYEKNFGDNPDTRDIKSVTAQEIPDHDLLVGGFPCQAFSVAGKHRGFEDTRGTLFFDVARILNYKRPRYFILENVKGLLSHDGGKTFSTILGVLTDLGYNVTWQVLNSKNFGVPQNRERVFIIGSIGGQPRPEIFPLRQSIEPLESSTAIDANYWKGADKHGQRTLIELTFNESDVSRVYDARGIAKTLKGLGGGLGAKTGLYATPRVRRLTPVECERLQGFPDNWTQLDASGRLISDTQRYKCLGNAVTVNVVQSIVEKLVKIV